MTAPVIGGIAWWADAWISPAGIASEEAFGSIHMGDPVPTLHPTGIPSAETFGALLVGYDQDVTATFVPSGEAFGEPMVLLGNAQGIRTFGIPSAEDVGTPTLIRSRMISGAGGIPSEEAFGTPTIPARPKFDTAAAAVGAYGGNPVVTINATEGAYAIADFGSNQAITIHAASYGGIPMTKVLDNGSPAMARFELDDVPGGPQAVGVAWSGGFANLSALTVRTYIGVQSATHPTKVTAFATGISDAEPCGPAEIVANAIGVTGPYLVGFSGGTQRGFAGAGGDGINAADSVSSETFVGGASGGANAWVSFNTILSGLSMRIDPTGIPSGEAFGTPAVVFDQFIEPTSIPSAEIVETPVLAQVLSASGIASEEAFGTAVVATGPSTIAPTGIASEEAFGNTIVSQGQLFVVPAGIASAEAFGGHTVTTGAVSVAPTGIGSAEAFGAATVGRGAVSVAPSAIGSAEAIGSHTVANTFTPFNEENTNRTAQAVPAGAVSLRITLIGAGSVGAAGGSGFGGTGGGGGGRVTTGIFPVASLGTTYSVARGMGGSGSGGASTFTSGSISLSAGGGTGGVGGTCSASGVAATTHNGSAGGTPTSTNGNPGANNTNNAGAGGGAGGSFAFGSYNGGAGGNSTTRTGGAANGGTPTAAAAGDGGAGGGGGLDGSPGGAGGLYGGGGGAGGNNGAGAAGGHGYTLIEWTLDQFAAPSGIASAEAFGGATVGRGPVNVSPTGIASAGAFGTPTVGVQQYVSPSSIASAEAFGTAAVGGILPLEFVGATITNGTSGAIPTHQTDDLLIVVPFGVGSGIPPVPTAGGAVPAWASELSLAGSFAGANCAVAKASAPGRTSGTWTGATKILAIVLRNQKPTSPVGGKSIVQTGTSTAATDPITQSVTDGTSMLLHIHCCGDGINDGTISATVPSGFTRRATSNTSPSVGYMAVNTKDSTTSDGSCVQACGTVWAISLQLEILQAT